MDRIRRYCDSFSPFGFLFFEQLHQVGQIPEFIGKFKTDLSENHDSFQDNLLDVVNERENFNGVKLFDESESKSWQLEEPLVDYVKVALSSTEIHLKESMLHELSQ